MSLKNTWSKAGYLLKETFKEFIQDNGLKLSAALSYYTIFSLPPLLIIIISWRYILARFLKTLVEGSKTYEDGKTLLNLAIEEYDQAVLDLAASIVSGIRTWNSMLTV